MVTNIIFYFSSLILFASGLGVLMYCYYKEHDCVYHFKNTFPYELNYTKVNSLSVIGKIFIVLSIIIMGGFFIVYPGENRQFLGSIKVMVSFVAIFGILTLLSMLALAVIDMRNVKVHLIGDTFLFTFAFILTIAIAIMGFWTLKNPHTIETIDVKKIVCSSIAVVEAIGLCILLFNPKLRNWSKLEEKSNEDGSKIFLRPKWFVLAYTEWAFFLSTFINGFLLFIMFM